MVTSGSHVTTTKKKNEGEKTGHAQNILPVRGPSGQGLFRLRDAAVVENIPTNIAYYYYGCCAISGCAFTPKGIPKGGSSDRRSHPVAILLLLRKRRGEKTGHAQNLLPVRATSGQGPFRPRDFVTSCQKDPTRADMAQLPVGHAQNILPDNHCRHFRSCD